MNPCMIIRIRYTGGTPPKINRMDTKHGGPWTKKHLRLEIWSPVGYEFVKFQGSNIFVNDQT